MTGHDCLAMPATLRGDAHGTWWAIAMGEHASFFSNWEVYFTLSTCSVYYFPGSSNEQDINGVDNSGWKGIISWSFKRILIAYKQSTIHRLLSNCDIAGTHGTTRTTIDLPSDVILPRWPSMSQPSRVNIVAPTWAVSRGIPTQ